MRIDAINSFLATRPVVDIPAVSRVKRDDAPAVETSKTMLPKEHYMDSIGKAHARPKASPVASQLSSHEMHALLALIQRERSRQDHVQTWFPSLLKV